jgi:hypothetical protein
LEETVLTLVEKILFALAVVVSLYFTYRGVVRIIGHVSSGQGKPDWGVIRKRLGQVVLKSVFFEPVFRHRPVVTPIQDLSYFITLASLGICTGSLPISSVWLLWLEWHRSPFVATCFVLQIYLRVNQRYLTLKHERVSCAILQSSRRRSLPIT